MWEAKTVKRLRLAIRKIALPKNGKKTTPMIAHWPQKLKDPAII